MSKTDTDQLDLLEIKHDWIRNSEYRIIKESNDFFFMRHNMTLNQQRLVLIAISELQFKKKADKEITSDVPPITLYVPDVAKALGISSNKRFYSDFYKAARGLGKIAFEKRIGPGEYEIVGLLEKARVSQGRGIIQIQFTKTALGYFGDLVDHYHRFQIRSIACLRTTYQMNLYRALTSVENTAHKTRKFWLYPEYLKDDSDLYLPDIMGYRPDKTKSYQLYKNVKRRILAPAIDGISEQTDISDIQIEEILKGRKVIGIKMRFRTEHSRRASLRAATQSWMHPVEFKFATQGYKTLTPEQQKSYDINGFGNEDIRLLFNQYLINNEAAIREEILGAGEHYPDVSTIDWYIEWLSESESAQVQMMQHCKYEKPGASAYINASESVTATWYARQFETTKAEKIPPSFQPDVPLMNWAEEFYPHIDKAQENNKFVLHARENGKTSKNWAIAWMRWIAGAKG